MEITKIKVSEINPAPYNPRKDFSQMIRRIKGSRLALTVSDLWSHWSGIDERRIWSEVIRD